jgi:hypothetical protein
MAEHRFRKAGVKGSNPFFGYRNKSIALSGLGARRQNSEKGDSCAYDLA